MPRPELTGAPFDVLVVGAGINGVGIAQDAALRGLRVALLEQDDLCSGVSAWSGRLVHGGLRYLEQYDFALVHESLLGAGAAVQAGPAPGQAEIADGADLQAQPQARLDGRARHDRLRLAVAAQDAADAPPAQHQAHPSAFPGRRHGRVVRIRGVLRRPARERRAADRRNRGGRAGRRRRDRHPRQGRRPPAGERQGDRRQGHRPAHRRELRGARVAGLQRRRSGHRPVVRRPVAARPAPAERRHQGQPPDRRPVPRLAQRRRLLRVPTGRPAGADHPVAWPIHDRHHRHPVRGGSRSRPVRHRRGRLPARRGQFADTGGQSHARRRPLHVQRRPPAAVRAGQGGVVSAAQPRAARPLRHRAARPGHRRRRQADHLPATR